MYSKLKQLVETLDCSQQYLHARDQYIVQSFYTVIALPEDGPIRPETCTTWWLFIILIVHLIQLCAFVGLNYSKRSLRLILTDPSGSAV